MDREYRDALGDDREGRYQQSLTILTSVISANHEGFVTVDAGLKSMATDAGPAVRRGASRRRAYAFFGDEQGLVTKWRRFRPFAAASGSNWCRRTVIRPIDKHDVIWLVHDDIVVDVIDVTARGRSQ
jgi:hypothetical protein